MEINQATKKFYQTVSSTPDLAYICTRTKIMQRNINGTSTALYADTVGDKNNQNAPKQQAIGYTLKAAKDQLVVFISLGQERPEITRYSRQQ